jgi:hypothetical protein
LHLRGLTQQYDFLDRVPKPLTDLLDPHGRMLPPRAETLKLGTVRAAFVRTEAAERAAEIVLIRRANHQSLDARVR